MRVDSEVWLGDWWEVKRRRGPNGAVDVTCIGVADTIVGLTIPTKDIPKIIEALQKEIEDA